MDNNNILRKLFLGTVRDQTLNYITRKYIKDLKLHLFSNFKIRVSKLCCYLNYENILKYLFNYTHNVKTEHEDFVLNDFKKKYKLEKIERFFDNDIKKKKIT